MNGIVTGLRAALRGALRAALGIALVAGPLALANADPGAPVDFSRNRGGKISLVVRDAPTAEVFEMLARKERVNILLGEGIDGNVSVHLFDVTVDRAIRAIAEAAGYVAERRHGTYVVIERDAAGKDSAHGNTEIRSFRIENADPQKVAAIVEKHLSRYGEVTILDQRRLLVVEDLPEFIRRIDRLLGELDRDPQQIFIEARILEVQLDEDETIGLDWSAPFKNSGVSVANLASPGTGLIFDLLTSEIELNLSALMRKGRVRTLSTPTLLAVEHKEAEVVIGDRLPYLVTTTINQVTTESVEFLESGVILRFTASVDREGRVVLDIHPEVSIGSLLGGLPTQRTTEVTTRLRAESGKSVFIAGLIRNSEIGNREGVPFLMDIPLLGRLFTRTTLVDFNTETVVILTAHVVDPEDHPLSAEKNELVDETGELLEESRRERSKRIAPVNPLTRSLGGVPLGGYVDPTLDPVHQSHGEPVPAGIGPGFD